MAEVTWFKVLTDIFADDKIKIIQSMPEGDALLVMWFKVLSQAGKTNDGGYIYLRKNIPYTPAMLATLFNKPQMIVELALKLFVDFEMIDIDDKGYLFVTNWEKHQSIDALEKIKEQDRIRSANYRERKRLELKENHVTLTLPSQRNHAPDKELELDIEIESNKEPFVDCDKEFERWYSTYPKAGSVKKKAYDSWKILWRDKKIDMNILISGTRAYIQYQNHNGYKVCGAQVFLNQQRWNDDWSIKNEIAFRPAKVDPVIENRKREIAFNQHMNNGGHEDEFIYNPASGA